MKRVHLLIKGRVHGVFFRANTRKKAREFGITGWVKNVPDGVEVVAEGEGSAVDSLIVYCRKGPMLARVDSVDLKEEKPKKEFSEFAVRY
ncbi:MAG: acylphosphatase [Nanoarchaeota archaeon]|nr:acylphosphatase [Nanoarchaeota archaeon]